MAMNLVDSSPISKTSQTMKLVYLMVLVCLGYFLVVVPLSSVKADRDDSDSESSSSDDSDEQR